MGNHAQFYGLIKKLPGAQKEDIVYAYSNGATTSLREFEQTDTKGYNLMLCELQKRVDMEHDRETKRLRSAILTRLQRYGVDTTQWHDVNRFLEQPRVAGKRLYDMQHDEMRALIPKLEIILKKHKTKTDSAIEIAKMN
jgi:hypothetical protein